MTPAGGRYWRWKYRHASKEKRLALAHGERNAVSAAYNHATYLKERRVLMQAWADHLDELRRGAKVVSLAQG